MRTLHKTCEHPVRGADLLRRRARAQQKGAQIPHRRRPHFFVAQESARIELDFETQEKARHFVFGRRLAFAGAHAARIGRLDAAHPLPADQQHGLREVQ